MASVQPLVSGAQHGVGDLVRVVVRVGLAVLVRHRLEEDVLQGRRPRVRRSVQRSPTGDDGQSGRDQRLNRTSLSGGSFFKIGNDHSVQVELINSHHFSLTGSKRIQSGTKCVSGPLFILFAC